MKSRRGQGGQGRGDLTHAGSEEWRPRDLDEVEAEHTQTGVHYRRTRGEVDSFQLSGLKNGIATEWEDGRSGQTG